MSEKLDATQRLTLGLLGLAATYHHEQRGEKPPTCHREILLYEFVRGIVNGTVKVRGIKAAAQQAIERWEQDAPDSGAIKLEDGDE